MRASSLRRNTQGISAAICSTRGCGRRSRRVKICRTWQLLTTTFFPPHPAPLQIHKPQRQQRQRPVGVPTIPTTHFVLPQTHFALAFRKYLFTAMPRCVHARQLRGRYFLRSVAERIPRLRFLMHGADHRQSFRRPLSLAIGPRLHAHGQHLHRQGAFRARTDRQLPPACRRLLRRPGVHPPPRYLTTTPPSPSPPSPSALQVTHQRLRPHFDDRAFAAVMQSIAEGNDAVEFAIRGDPGVRHVLATLDQGQGDLPMLLVDHSVGDVTGRSSKAVVGPVFGQEQLTVQAAVSLPARVSQKDADLAVIDFAQAAAPRTGHSAGGVAFLGEGAAVQDEDGVGVGPGIADVATELVHDRFIVPRRPADEGLKGLRATNFLASGGR